MFVSYETERFAGVKFPLALKKINSFHSQEQKQSDGGRGTPTGETLVPTFSVLKAIWTYKSSTAWFQTYKLRLVYADGWAWGCFWFSKTVYPLISFLHSPAALEHPQNNVYWLRLGSVLLLNSEVFCSLWDYVISCAQQWAASHKFWITPACSQCSFQIQTQLTCFTGSQQSNQPSELAPFITRARVQ